MAAQAVQPQSKSAKKKATKALERTESPAPSVASATADKNSDDSFESPYIKEIQKNIRNVNKKIVRACVYAPLCLTLVMLTLRPDQRLQDRFPSSPESWQVT
jgi:hypothetical protein